MRHVIIRKLARINWIVSISEKDPSGTNYGGILGLRNISRKYFLQGRSKGDKLLENIGIQIKECQYI
ncbi:hypothetical protein AV530_008484 [Patagioenas fasciata monilis]|uniref:Uncharacterized protein n=1 Tax=Patagioenas fasciata monilis TaxID=372326 RepID=A0A1V4KPV9_PATFA|nr:hypothetical protein AV530_008484 [Patagioenas fasciata monilis]